MIEINDHLACILGLGPLPLHSCIQRSFKCGGKEHRGILLAFHPFKANCLKWTAEQPSLSYSFLEQLAGWKNADRRMRRRRLIDGICSYIVAIKQDTRLLFWMPWCQFGKSNCPVELWMARTADSATAIDFQPMRFQSRAHLGSVKIHCVRSLPCARSKALRGSL